MHWQHYMKSVSGDVKKRFEIVVFHCRTLPNLQEKYSGNANNGSRQRITSPSIFGRDRIVVIRLSAKRCIALQQRAATTDHEGPSPDMPRSADCGLTVRGVSLINVMPEWFMIGVLDSTDGIPDPGF